MLIQINTTALALSEVDATLAGGIALAALEVAAAEVTIGLHMTDHGLDGGAAAELAFDRSEDAALLAGDEDAVRI